MYHNKIRWRDGILKMGCDAEALPLGVSNCIWESRTKTRSKFKCCWTFSLQGFWREFWRICVRRNKFLYQIILKRNDQIVGKTWPVSDFKDVSTPSGVCRCSAVRMSGISSCNLVWSCYSSHCHHLEMLFIGSTLSLPCCDSLFPNSGFGIKKVSVVNMKASQYVPIHSKQIRGLSFNRQNDSLLLSAALDNTVKLTRYTCVCTRTFMWEQMCVFLYLWHIEYQNTHSTTIAFY